MVNNKLHYGVFGLALLLFIVGFLSIFQGPKSTAGQARAWQETEVPLVRHPAVMEPENRWDAQFVRGVEEHPEPDISESFELVGVVGSDHSHALIRIKEPIDKSGSDIKRIKEGGVLVGAVKVVRIDAARVTIQSKDSQSVLTLYSRPTEEDEQAPEKKVES